LVISLFSFTACSEVDHSDEYYEIGKIYYDFGLYEQAIKEFSNAIQIKEKPEYYFYRGKSYYMLFEYEDAVSDFTKSIDLKYSEIEDAYYLRSYSYLMLDKYDESISDGNYLIINSDDDFYKYSGNFMLGLANQMQNKNDEALTYFKEAKNFLNTVIVNFAIGSIYFLQFEYKTAINYFEESVLMEADCSSYKYLADSYRHIGNFQKAIFNYNLGVDNCSEDAEQYRLIYYRSLSYLELEQYDNALYDADTLTDIFEYAKFSTYYIQGRVYLAEKDYDNALYLLDESVDEYNGSANTYKYRFLVNKILENNETLDSDFQRALDLYKEDISEYNNLDISELYLFAGDYNKSLEYFNKTGNLINENYFAIKIKEKLDFNLTLTSEQ
jgi:tetratricopeptide (TPR) repeat protein